jgi:hypothetical protein
VGSDYHGLGYAFTRDNIRSISAVVIAMTGWHEGMMNSSKVVVKRCSVSHVVRPLPRTRAAHKQLWATLE